MKDLIQQRRALYDFYLDKWNFVEVKSHLLHSKHSKRLNGNKVSVRRKDKRKPGIIGATSIPELVKISLMREELKVHIKKLSLFISKYN